MEPVGSLTRPVKQIPQTFQPRFQHVIPWDKIRDLSGQTSSLGLELMETPSAGLSDMAIKVQWLPKVTPCSLGTPVATECYVHHMFR